MSVVTPENSSCHASADEHRQWLGQFHPRHLKTWNDCFQNNEETALSEASVRRMLQSNNVRVCPGEGHDGIAGGPDFLCSVSGQEFFVEATNIAKDKADTETGWLNAPRFMPLNKLVFEACDSKERQCRVRKAPVLLAIATFSESSMLAFSPPYPVQMITGRIEHTIHFSPGSATCVGETKSTELKHSAFLVFDTDGLVHIRAAIAGLILYGPTVGIVSGVLNPLATCPFRPDWIPSLQFETVEIDNVNLQMRLNPGNR